MADLSFLDRHGERIAESHEAILRFWNCEPNPRIPVTVYVPRTFSLTEGPLCSAGTYYTDRDVNLQAQLSSLRSRLECLHDDFLPYLDTYIGTPVVASAFGGRVQYFEDKDPWIEQPLIVDPRQIDHLRMPDPTAGGMTAKILEWMRYWREETGGRIPLSMTDIQGPLSVGIDLMGATSFYLALYDHPARVHALLGMISEVIVRFLEALLPLVETEEGIHEWTGIFFPKGRGRFRLSEDNLISLSPQMYREFIHPYNELIFREVGGGLLHWCGDGSNNFETALRTEGLCGVHNSTMGNMDLIVSQIRRIAQINREEGRKLVYFSSMVLPVSVGDARELMMREGDAPGVLNFVFYPLDGYGVCFAEGPGAGYRPLEDEPEEILAVFLEEPEGRQAGWAER